MASEATAGQMMHENYMGYQMQQRPDMPSTSNAPVMPNYSMDEAAQQNVPNPSMMHPPSQDSSGGYPQPNYQQMAYQNQYGSGNGPPSAQPMFSNANPYFSHQNGGNNSKMNTPTYGNSTPTYPQNPQMGYCPPNSMCIQGQPNGMMPFQGGMSGSSTPNYPNAPGSMQPPGSHPDPNFDANGDPQYMQKQCPNGIDMNAYAHQMRIQQNFPQKVSQKKAICFNSEMLNQMAHSLKNNEVESPYAWHQNFMEQNQQGMGKSSSRKRKLSPSSSPMFNGNMQQPDYMQPTQVVMTEFQQPMSMTSDPPSIHDPNAGTSINGMRPYIKQEIKKDEDDPLRGLERMTNASLESTQNKGYSQRNDTKKQEDKKVKLAKLDSLATDLNLQPDFNPTMVPRLSHPMQMPGGPPGMPPMMPMPPGMRPYFDPSMRPVMGPPGGMMYPPNPSSMVSPNMHPMQQPPPYSMASPKYPPMMNRPPFMPSDNMMRPGMPPDMQAAWMQQQQQIRQQMMKQQEVAAGGVMYSQ